MRYRKKTWLGNCDLHVQRYFVYFEYSFQKMKHEIFQRCHKVSTVSEFFYLGLVC